MTDDPIYRTHERDADVRAFSDYRTLTQQAGEQRRELRQAWSLPAHEHVGVPENED